MNGAHCPSWCDPRTHLQHDAENHEHRSAPLEWKAGADDVTVTVGLVQLEDTGAFPSTGDVNVRLELRNIDTNETAGIDLDAADCHMLSGAIGLVVGQLHATHSRAIRAA